MLVNRRAAISFEVLVRSECCVLISARSAVHRSIVLIIFHTLHVRGHCAGLSRRLQSSRCLEATIVTIVLRELLDDIRAYGLGEGSATMARVAHFGAGLRLRDAAQVLVHESFYLT